MEDTGRVLIGMDPHKRAVTIEVMAADETVLEGPRRFTTDVAGFEAMLAHAAAWPWPERVWRSRGVRASGSTWCSGCSTAASRC